MKNKNHKNLGFEYGSFAEKRFVFATPPAAPSTGPSESADKPKKKPDSGKDLAKLGSKVEAAKLAKEIDEGRKVALEQAINGLKEWKISVARRSTPNINADKWDITSKTGLDAVKSDWKKLGIYTDNAFYKKIFEELGNSANAKGFLDKIDTSSTARANAYKNPARHKDKLASLTSPSFASAYSFYEAVQTMVKSQDIGQKDTHENQQEKGKATIVDRVAKGVSDNSKKFVEALKNRDYATAAVYVVGLFAMYKAYKSLPDEKKGWIGKAAAWGGAAYAINLFAKNAGIDIGEKLGITDHEAEIEGTPLAALWKVEGVKNLENLDSQSAGILRDVSFVNLGSLYDKYQESNAAGKSGRAAFHFIDPAAFGTSFPEFKGMRPTDIAGKSKALKYKHENYRNTGRKLYTLVQAMEDAYESTMRKPGDKSFAEVLKTGTLKNSTVFDFMVALRSYAATSKPEGTFLDIAKSGKISDVFDKALAGRNLAFGLEKGELKPGVFEGSVMDFPIVVQTDGKNGLYRVYSRADYEASGGNPHISKAMADFPIKKGRDLSKPSNELVAAVTGKVNDLRKVFNKEAGKTVAMGPVKYSPDGYWLSTLDYKRGKLLKGATRKIDVKIRPGVDGTTLRVTKLDNEVLVHIEDVMDKGKLHGSLVLSELVQQSSGTNLTPLLWFYQNRQLKFIDGDESDNKFKIKIGNVNIDGVNEFEIEFDGSSYKFVDSGLEKKLVQDHVFRHEIAESIAEQGRLNDVTESFRNLLEGTPESFFIHFFKSVPKWFTEATLSHPFKGVNLSDFTGSVPKNYFLSLLDAQKALVMAKFARSADSANSFDDLASLQSDIVDPAVVKLEAARDKFSTNISNKERTGQDFGESEFMVGVTEDLIKAGTVSKDYRNWYWKFVNDVFDRYGKHDGSKGNTEKAAGLIKIFSHYTAFLDKAGLDGSDPSITFSPEMVKSIDALEKAKAKLGASATKAALAAESGINSADLATVEKAAVAKDRAEKYRLAGDYVDYVSGRIFLRMNEGAVNNNIPAPGAFWRIDPFEEFKIHRPSSGHEIVDKRPRLKMKKDYTTFDAYLKMTKAKRAEIKREDIVLPRKNVTLKFVKGQDKEAFKIYLDLIGNKAIPLKQSGVKALPPEAQIESNSAIPKDSMERYFHEKMRDALDALKKEYPKEYRIGKFADLMHDYSLDMANTAKVFAAGGKSGMEVSFNFRPSSLSKEVDRIESELTSRSKLTITRQMQEQMADRRVAEIIEKQIKNNANFDKYFDRNTIPKMAKNMWLSVKRFLFG